MSAQPGACAAVIRPMRHADIDAVLEIEARAYRFPWSRTIFGDCLIAGYFANVIELDGQVAGYSILSTAAAEAHILNLCIDPARQRRGLGRQLLEHLLDYARDIGVERIFLEVRPSNEAAVQLYASAGFVRLGVRKSYYRAADGREDAMVLVLEMLPADD